MPESLWDSQRRFACAVVTKFNSILTTDGHGWTRIKKPGRRGASLRVRRRGGLESAGWQAAARRGLRALPSLGKSHDQSQMNTDRTCNSTEDHPQRKWITRLKIRVSLCPSVVYEFFGWLQLPFLGLVLIGPDFFNRAAAPCPAAAAFAHRHRSGPRHKCGARARCRSRAA